jgi:hypothetical protein
MSHQTGATFDVVLFQTTELMNAFKQPRPAQAMYKEVPALQARTESRVNNGNKKNDVERTHIPNANKVEWHRVKNR